MLAAMTVKTASNVLIPRMPKHGYADRMTDALATLRAEELIATTSEAIDIACGLGERVAVLGISMGGLLAAYFGQYRSDVATAVPIAPDFSVLRLSLDMTGALAAIGRVAPNIFLWWDPKLKSAQRPRTAYPRFATRALAQSIRIGDAVVTAAKVKPPVAARIATVVNTADPAVNNDATKYVVGLWKELRSDGIEYVQYGDLPKNHDIIDPDNSQARTDIVYPRLLETLALTPR